MMFKKRKKPENAISEPEPIGGVIVLGRPDGSPIVELSISRGDDGSVQTFARTSARTAKEAAFAIQLLNNMAADFGRATEHLRPYARSEAELPKISVRPIMRPLSEE